jgi:O-antigen/teichoic acid export membrane protein
VFSVGGARVAGVIITSLTFPFILRRLGVEMYGLWSYVVALCAFLDIIANPGFTTYATQQLSARREAAFDIVPDIMALRFMSSLIAGAALFLLVSFESRAEVRQMFCLFGTGLLIVNLGASDYILTALELFHARSLLAVAQQALYAIAIFSLVREPKDVLKIPAAILASSLLSSVAGWVILWKRGFRIRRQPNPAAWRGIIVPSLHYAVSSFMSSSYHRMGHIVVRWFLGDYALGLYSAAVRFVDLLRNFITIVLNVMTPRLALSADSNAGLKRLVRFAFVMTAAISLPLTLGLLASAHLVVPWILGAKYRAAVPLVQWMSFFMITGPAASLFSGSVLYATGRYRAYLISTSGGAVFGAVLYLLLTEKMGLNGAGLAFVLGELIVATIAYLSLPQQLLGLWKNRVLLVSLISAVLMMVAVRIVSIYNSNPLVVVACGAFVYLILSGWSFKKWLVLQLGAIA